MDAVAAENRWYAEHNCTHAHCPLRCEHPQPALTTDGRMLCMRCWVVDRLVTECVPCTPDTCPDD